MKFSISTKQLQDLVTKAIKCSSNNKLIPVTNFMEIRLAGSKLSLITTDRTNYLRVQQDVDSTDSFNVVVTAESFAKLISRMTCDTITFELDDKSLTVIGGKSKYKIELILDADGTILKEIPKPKSEDLETIQPETISVASINSIINTAKSALSTDLTVPILTAYYVGDSVMSTDQLKICCIADKLVDKPLLISAQTMDLLQLMPEEDETEIAYYRSDDGIAFRTKNCALITKAFDGVETYPIDVMNKFVESKFDNECSVRKDDILQALDRLSLFVGPYDKNVILLTFGNGSLVMQNKKSVGTEDIDCLSGGEGEFNCAIDVELFKSQIRVNSTDNVTIQYGLDNCIKIVDGNAVQIVCLCKE